MINVKLMDFYRTNKVGSRLPNLNMKNIIGSEGRGTRFPQLTGKIVKAASTRALVPFLVELARQCDHGLPFQRHRRKMIEWLDCVYKIMYEGEMFLTEDESDQLSHAVLRFSLHYTWLVNCCTANGNLYFNVVPKHHYLCHVPEQSRLINPRFVHNYREESFVGRLTTIYASCANGRYKQVVQQTALTKYLVGLQILFSNLEG